MINLEYINELEKKLTTDNNPFPHIISKNFLPTNIVRQAESEFEEFKNLENAGGYRYGNLKYHYDKYEQMPKTIKYLISFFYSKEFIGLLERKFNLSNIVTAWVNSVLFVMLGLERCLHLNIQFPKVSFIILWFILCYIINYTIPQCYIIIYICFILYFTNLELKLLLDPY